MRSVGFGKGNPFGISSRNASFCMASAPGPEGSRRTAESSDPVGANRYGDGMPSETTSGSSSAPSESNRSNESGTPSDMSGISKTDESSESAGALNISDVRSKGAVSSDGSRSICGRDESCKSSEQRETVSWQKNKKTGRYIMKMFDY